MAFYAYTCAYHGTFDSTQRGDRHPCPTCGDPAIRRWSWTMGSVMQAHYSPSFGCEISSTAQARELAKRASDEQSARLGTTVDYKLVDALDTEAHGVTKSEVANWKEAGAEPTNYTLSGTAKREQDKARAKMKADALSRVAATSRDSLSR